MRSISFARPINLAFGVLLVIVLALTLGGRGAAARPNTDGDLDPGFGNSGYVATDFGRGYGGQANAMAVLPDGKILAAGAALNGDGSPDGFVLARYNSDGSLDTSFGISGTVKTWFRNSSASANALAVQSDGKIVLAGNASGIDTGLSRFNPDGSLDATFGDGGVVSINLFDGLDSAHAVAIQADGRIVIAGGTYEAGSHGPDDPYEDGAFVVARFTTTGALDTTFGSGGSVQIWADLTVAEANGLTIDDKGRIVAVGTIVCSSVVWDDCSVYDAMIVRLLPNGSFDNSFSSDGLLQTSAVDSLSAVGIDVQGRIVGAGGDGWRIALLRLEDNGTLDQTFGGDGVVFTDFYNNYDFARAMGLSGDKIIVAGRTRANHDVMAVARYDADGSLDTTFDSDGKQTLAYAQEAHAAALSVAEDGKVVLAGVVANTFALARLLPSGELDTSFGAGGTTLTTFTGNGSADEIHALAEGPDEMIIAGGSSDGSFALARYTAAGALDPSFGVGGLETTDLPAPASIAALALQSNGKITAAGGANGLFTVARYLPDGGIDTSFGADGTTRVDVGSPSAGIAALRIDAAGKISAVGAVGSKLVLLRLNADGTQDSTFAPGGFISTTEGPNEDPQFDQAGRIVSFSSAGNAIGATLVVTVARYLPDGTFDQSFGTQGTSNARMPVNTGGYVINRITDITVGLDGRVVVAATSIFCSSSGCGANVAPVFEFSSDGTLNQAYGIAGLSTDGATFGDTSTTALVAVQADNKVLRLDSIGGQTNLIRLQSNGSRDHSFGTNGVATVNIEAPSAPNTLLVLRDGDIIVAGGRIHGDGASDFTLLRFQNRPTFNDVAPTDYFFEPVTALTEQGALSGYADGSFRPFNNTTRAQLVKIIVLAERQELQTPATPTFADVPPSSPFYSFVETAAYNHIISGYDTAHGREFRPQNNVTRGQLAKIVVASKPGWSLINPATPSFSDVPRDDTFYRYVETARAHAVISGYADGTFHSGADATRGQVSKIVYFAAPQK